MRPTIDAIAPRLVLAQGLVRIGCTLNGDAWGGLTRSPVALVYTHSDALLPERLHRVATHPYPLYDLALKLAIFAVVWRLRVRSLAPGMLFALYAGLYAAGRSGINFVRQERARIWGLQQAQLIALLMLLVSAGALALLSRDVAREWSSACAGWAMRVMIL